MQAYKLPPENYYNYSACAAKGETVRFYDSTPNSNKHGSAICSDDCIRLNKNAILQGTPINRLKTVNPACGPDFDGYFDSDLVQPCSVAMKNLDFNIFQYIGRDHCVGDTNVRPHPDRPIYGLMSSYMRIKIFSILNSIVEPSSGNNLLRDFEDSGSLYIPSNGAVSGSLIPFFNGNTMDNNIKIDLLGHLAEFYSNFDSPNNYVKNVLSTCMDVGDDADNIAKVLAREDDFINHCRMTYKTSYGTSIVANDLELQPIPSNRDKLGSMGLGCLYALQIYDDKTKRCPKIQNLCKKLKGIQGTWEFGLTKNDYPADLISKHTCRNYFGGENNGSKYNTFFDINANIYTTNEIISGFDPEIIINSSRTFVNYGFDPAVLPNYIYRSCDLSAYTEDVDPNIDTRLNCCANDFSDLNSTDLFKPGKKDPPTAVPGIIPDIVNKSILFGYDYENNGTPNYNRCFNQNGYVCDSDYRDITNINCSRLMQIHCFGENDILHTSNDKSWVLDPIGTGECAKWIGRNIYGNEGKWRTFIDIVGRRDLLPSFVGTKMSNETLSFILEQIPTFLSMDDIKNIVDNTGLADPLKANVEPIFFTLYKSYNLNLYDNGWLSGQCSKYGIKDIQNNSLLRKWCGCSLSSSIYESRYPGIASECTPLCNSSDVLQFGQQCEGSSCIIDDVTFNIINSTTGTLSISQVCNSCGNLSVTDTTTISQKCNCTIGNNIDINVVSSKIGNISIDQLCKGTSSSSKSSNNASQQQLGAKQILKNILSVKSYKYISELPSTIFVLIGTILFLTLVYINKPIVRNGFLVTLLLIVLLGVLLFVFDIIATYKDEIKKKADEELKAIRKKI